MPTSLSVGALSTSTRTCWWPNFGSWSGFLRIHTFRDRCARWDPWSPLDGSIAWCCGHSHDGTGSTYSYLDWPSQLLCRRLTEVLLILYFYQDLALGTRRGVYIILAGEGFWLGVLSVEQVWLLCLGFAWFSAGLLLPGLFVQLPLGLISLLYVDILGMGVSNFE